MSKKKGKKTTWICHSCGKKCTKWEINHGPDADLCDDCYRKHADW